MTAMKCFDRLWSLLSAKFKDQNESHSWMISLMIENITIGHEHFHIIGTPVNTRAMHN